MEHYQIYTFDDFMVDESFRCWVLSPSPELSEIWEQIMQSYPEQSEVILHAKFMLLAVHERFNEVPKQADIKSNIRSIVDAAKRSEFSHSAKGLNSEVNQFKWLRFAASVAVLLTVGLWLFKQIASDTDSIVRYNNSKAAITLFLSDSSMVILESGSTLIYPEKFSGKTREVELLGNAFFEIKRNVHLPFLVVTAQTVTKVLGTSFRISSNGNDNPVTVAVKTGKVAVFSREENIKEIENNSSQNQVLLVENQQVIFSNKQEKELGRIVSVQDISAKESKLAENHSYEDVPVPIILHALELEYGIKIGFDTKILSGCLLNTEFAQEFLHQKLLTICKAIGATYEIRDGRITITSHGCS